MRSTLWQLAHLLTTVTLILTLATPCTLMAQDDPHLVSPSDLQKAVIDHSQTRQQNIDTLNNFLTIPQAQQALQSAHVSPQQVKKAVAGMSDEELAQLAARAQKAQADFAAGSSTLVIVVLVIVAIIIVIAIIH